MQQSILIRSAKVVLIIAPPVAVKASINRTSQFIQKIESEYQSALSQAKPGKRAESISIKIAQ
jgi:hypothetical protein